MELIEEKVGRDPANMILDAAIRAMQRDVWCAYEEYGKTAREIMRREELMIGPITKQSQRSAHFVDSLNIDRTTTVSPRRREVRQSYTDFMSYKTPRCSLSLSPAQMNTILRIVTCQYRDLLQKLGDTEALIQREHARVMKIMEQYMTRRHYSEI